MKKIIINADDFGYSDGICKSILELIDAGAITGTSLMCAAANASPRMQRWGVSSLRGYAGVHLQLTGGRPLSPTQDVQSLVISETGNFRNPREGMLPDPTQVESEWRLQIEAATQLLGATPTHLDSHHGVHRIPEFFDVYARLAKELGVPVRGAGGEIGLKMRKEGIAGSVALVRDWTGRSLGPDALREMVRSVIAEYPDEETIEVITHPGYNDAYLSSVSSLAAARDDEHRSLMDLARTRWPEADGHMLTRHDSLLS